MTDLLDGKIALVTGSTSGIGLAIAKALAGAGAKIAVNGLCDPEESAAALDAVKAAGAPEARFFDADLTDAAAIDAMMDEIGEWGGARVVVNNAGMQKTVSLEECGRDLYDRVLALNLSACFHTMHRAMPGMREAGFGRVINIASVHGLVASVHKAPYVSSKFGLVGLTKVAALEYAEAGSRESGGVTVNAICPGWVETPLIEPQIAAMTEKSGGSRADGVKALLSEKEPSLRFAAPEDIGALALFLCSQAAHNITGVSIPVDGGWTAQ